MKSIKVVAAVIRDGNRIFATQRGYTYWPGLQNDTPITVTLWEGV